MLNESPGDDQTILSGIEGCADPHYVRVVAGRLAHRGPGFQHILIPA